MLTWFFFPLLGHFDVRMREFHVENGSLAILGVVESRCHPS